MSDAGALRSLATVRAIYDAFRRRDGAAIAGLVAPDVVVTQTPLLPWGGERRGPDGVRQFLAALTAAVDSTFEPAQLLPAGDQVVAVGRSRGTVRATGRAFDVAAVHAWTLRDGRVTRYEAWLDTPAMLAALEPDATR